MRCCWRRGLAWGLGHVGPARPPASAGPGLPPPLLGLSSGDSVGGGVAVRFSFRGGGRGPGSGGSSVSCVWVLSTESSPQGCVTHWPGSPGCRASVGGQSGLRVMGCSGPGPGPAGGRAGRGPRAGAPLCVCVCVALCSPARSSPLAAPGPPRVFLAVLLQGPACPEVAVTSRPELCLVSAPPLRGWSPGRDRVEPRSGGKCQVELGPPPPSTQGPDRSQAGAGAGNRSRRASGVPAAPSPSGPRA